MFISARSLLLPVILLSVPSTAVLAEGMADRYNESNVQQAMNAIDDIHEMYGPTAAGPAGSKAAMTRGTDAETAHSLGTIDFPPGVVTAHERKRYIFDSEKF